MCLIDQFAQIVDRAEVWLDRVEVTDVVPGVAQRRLEDRREPDTVDSEPLEVIEGLGEPAKITDAVRPARRTVAT